MTFLTARQIPSRADAVFLPAWAMMRSVSAAVALLALSAHAQNAESPAPAAEIAAAAPRYAASDLELAFGFMDGNKDGKVSREEAAGFRGVAKHFDEADTNHDNFLSREEFDKAMNYVKPK
ncbi:MAG: EF-hand domain-containing protein [Polaromonas sp.]